MISKVLVAWLHERKLCALFNTVLSDGVFFVVQLLQNREIALFSNWIEIAYCTGH